MIGVYGGTFDPVHFGHLRTALEVKELLELDEIRLVPCRQPPHRGSPQATPAQRRQMLELALREAEPGVRIDTLELERAGPSYMFDTVTALRQELGHEVPLCLILGQDAFQGLPFWHRWRELAQLTHFAVMRRPDFPSEDVRDDLREWVRNRVVDPAQGLKAQPGGGVGFIEVSQLAISATQIRALVQAGRSPRYLLPDAVLAFIREQKLYLE